MLRRPAASVHNFQADGPTANEPCIGDKILGLLCDPSMLAGSGADVLGRVVGFPPVCYLMYA